MSIFLLPLDKIDNRIRENNWIKSTKLSTNYKDTINIEIKEHKPFGIYEYSNKKFYFDNSGKIIDQVNENNNSNLKFIVFSGQSYNFEASNIL